jgi:hypothetical protein
MVLIVLYAVAANACSDTPPSEDLYDAGTLEQISEGKTSELAPWQGNTVSSEASNLNDATTSSGNTQAEPVCFNSDVKALCCPSACAVKRSLKWSKADETLRACMKGIGCSDSESKSATVFMRCSCSMGKP